MSDYNEGLVAGIFVGTVAVVILALTLPICKAKADDLPTIPDRPGATNLYVPGTDRHLHGFNGFYDTKTDTIYVRNDLPAEDCLARLLEHEEFHRQQFYRGEDPSTAHSERMATMNSMSRSCSDMGHGPSFKALVDTME